MARHGKISYISITAEMIPWPATKKVSKQLARIFSFGHTASFWLVLFAVCACISMFKMFLTCHLWQFPCSIPRPSMDINAYWLASVQPNALPSNRHPAKARNVSSTNMSEREKQFWKQPDGLGYRPCIHFSKEYSQKSPNITNERRRFLMVVVAGGLNQQRNQIVDAVIIARILGAALVVPILQVNIVWKDDSEFSDIFDAEHFKSTLKDDVRVVNSLPSTHLTVRPVEEDNAPLHVSPSWIRSRYLKRIKTEGVLLVRGLEARLTKDLPPDLLKLRCKVQFEALRFAQAIQAVGNKLAERMSSGGPYVALHLRLEKDVWVRTGCLPGLSARDDEIVQRERKAQPLLLTGRSNMTYRDRKLAGLCPLNAMEVARLLKGLGAPSTARIYWAGGEPLGGEEALESLVRDFPNLYNKQSLALPGELDPFMKRASALAAIDYIVALSSDVFMPSHGGNMGKAIRGHRAYAGHRKHVTPNKRQMLPYIMDAALSEQQFGSIIRRLHSKSVGQPAFRTVGRERDSVAYPVPDCMCTNRTKPKP